MRVQKLAVAGVVLLLLVPLVSAFGVTAPYWKEKPLRLWPGQSADVSLLLQNMVGNEDIHVQVKLVEGGGIATLVDSDLVYDVPLGRKDVAVPIHVFVPDDAPAYGDYRIGVSFTRIASNEEGMLQMSTGVKTYIPVFIEGGLRPEEPAAAAAVADLAEEKAEAAQQPKPTKAEAAQPPTLLALATVFLLVVALLVVLHLLVQRSRR